MINTIRKTLYNNNQTITITDFGSGSKVFKSNQRKVASIVKIAGISKKRASILLNIVEYFTPQNILEIGTSVGLGTSTLSISNPKAKITTLEGCENTSEIALQLFNKYNLTNIKLHVGNFNKTLPKVVNNNSFDLVYFDGNHQKKATLNYFEICLPNTHNNTVFIFDDINWSKEMKQAWSIIKSHPKVTVTISTFFWGIVFFRKEQAKQHFIIRI